MIKAEVNRMLVENEERQRSLFPDYDPITGVGAPGERRLLVVEDLMLGACAEWYVPTEMYESEMLVRIISEARSIERACLLVYGDYDEDLRDTMVRSFLQMRAKYDFYFYAYCYARIKNKEGGDDIPFKLRPAQIKLVKDFEYQRLNGLPIRNILLKARQWGGSTATQIYMSWIQVLWMKSWSSIIVGHQGDSAAEVKDMYVKLITNLPDFLFYEPGKEYDSSQPKIKGGGTQNISLIPARNCKIKTATALNPEGARGGDSSLAHCTEVAFWPLTEKMDPQKQVKSSCSSVLFKPYTMIVYESTANGQNFFKGEWDRAGEYDDYGEKVSAFRQVFVAWWEIESYTQSFALRDGNGDYTKATFARILIERREDKKNHWDYLYWLWTIGATLEGIYWYWHKMREYKDLQDMQQEYPSDAVEAFKYSGTNEFDIYTIEKRKKWCKAPCFKGDLYGKSPKGNESVEGLHLVAEDAGSMSIWEYPDEKNTYTNRYFISVDIGGKYKTSDWSVITVLDRADMMSEDGVLDEDCGPTVVAEWVGHTDADLLAIKCAQISKYYDNGLVIVENNTAYSKLNDVDSDDVTELFFPILLPLCDNVYAHNRSELDKSGNHAEVKYGFNTNKSTKVSIIKYLGTCLRDGLWVERSRETLNEMTYYMKFPNGKYGAIAGKHDDRVMSRAIGLWVSRFDWDRYPVRRRKSKEEVATALRRLNSHGRNVSVLVNN